MKTHTYLLALVLVAFSFGLQANSGKNKENESEIAKTQILDVVDTEKLPVDDCVTCPVPVQVFDKDFNLVITGEMGPMQEVANKKLQVILGQSNLIMDSGAVLIYQLEE